jgi:predicted transcriptional regulator
MLVGIVTEGDFLRRVETGTLRPRRRWLEVLLGPGRMAEAYADTHGRKVADVMTPQPLSVAEDTPLAEVVDIMERNRVKRLPVVRGGGLVGIVSRANVLHAVAGLSPTAIAAAATDSTIRDQILAELGKESWAPVALVDVTVREGVVHLWGTLVDERQRRAVGVVAENVPGVKAVHDHLVYDPIAGVAV